MAAVSMQSAVLENLMIILDISLHAIWKQWLTANVNLIFPCLRKCGFIIKARCLTGENLAPRRTAMDIFHYYYCIQGALVVRGTSVLLIYDSQWGKQHTPCVHLKDRDKNGYMTNSWNSAQLHLFLCDRQGVTTHNGAIKTWWKPQLNSMGQRPCISNGLSLWNSPSVRRRDWTQILKLSRLQFKAGSGSSTSLSAEQ